jgi:hypothetical protein
VGASTTVILAAAMMIVAVARSTWSPCSLSMLSMVTPLGEASRGNRYATTAVAFIAGATVGGAVLGLLIAVLAVVMGGLSLADRSVALAVVVTAVVTIASDTGVAGFALPRVARQVDEKWLTRYRGWVYGSAYGAQIGFGLSTYVMTGGLYLMIVLGALTGRPLVGVLVGVGFGVGRGLAFLLGRRLSSPGAIRAMHAWFDAAAPWSVRGALAGQAAVLAVAVVSGGLAAAICAAVVLGVLALVRVAGPGREPRRDVRVVVTSQRSLRRLLTRPGHGS